MNADCRSISAQLAGEQAKRFAKLEKALAECQAREAKLREALEIAWSGEYVSGMEARRLAQQALALPQDDTALRNLLADVRKEALLETAPEGWKLVPIEPTDTMVALMMWSVSAHFTAIQRWERVLAAAPEYKGDKE